MAAYGFNASDVRRIGELVRAAEHGRVGQVSLGADSHDSAKPGVRLLIAKHEGAGWATDSTAVVTIYNGDQGSIGSAMTMVAYNQYITFSSGTNCTSRWVALGHNGFAWHPIDSQSDCGTCVYESGGVDFRAVRGYARTAVQILGHDSLGCIQWFDIATCATAAE